VVLNQWFTDSLVAHVNFHFLQCRARGANSKRNKNRPGRINELRSGEVVGNYSFRGGILNQSVNKKSRSGQLSENRRHLARQGSARAPRRLLSNLPSGRQRACLRELLTRQTEQPCPVLRGNAPAPDHAAGRLRTLLIIRSPSRCRVRRRS
jgi:hypothetical protein